jgi:hypothetical protein
MAEQTRDNSGENSSGTVPVGKKGVGDPGTTGSGSGGSAAGGLSGNVGERGTTKGEMPAAEVSDRSLGEDTGSNLGTIGEMIADGDTVPTTRAGSAN